MANPSLTRSAQCAVDGCGKPRRKVGFCDQHYQAARRHGGDPLGVKYNVQPVAEQCILCGATPLLLGSRSYCSAACRQDAYRSHQRGWLRQNRACVGCGLEISADRVNGKNLNAPTKRFCDACRGKPRRSYRLAVHILAFYQGTACAICGNDVDMSVRFPDPDCASVDHIVPLSAGGNEEDVSNLQLAHFGCNSSKRNRTDEGAI